MKVLCAWCQREGRPAIIGEREPFDDPKETHGICPPHAQRLLAELGPSSLDQVDLLVVVAPRETGVYDHLTEALAGLRGVQVILERRRGGRRPDRWPADRERRRDVPPDPWADPTLGYTVIRLGDR